MFRNYIIIAMLFCFTFSIVKSSYAQEHEEGGFTIEAPVAIESDLVLEPPVPVESDLKIERVEPAEDGFLIERQLKPSGDDFVIEEEIVAPILFEDEEPAEEKVAPGQFVTAEMLNPVIVEPAIKYYIHSDINRKFTGLITNLKLEKIYGVIQDKKTATVFFDYSYTSVRNRDSIILDKGKMTFIKFNSGKWFNEELSIYMLDKYQPYRRSITGELQQLDAK